jgi:hypothetical protein
MGVGACPLARLAVLGAPKSMKAGRGIDVRPVAANYSALLAGRGGGKSNGCRR